jgi:hypothetical protein
MNQNKLVTVRTIVAVLAMLAGIVLAVMELASGPKFFGAISALASGFMAGGLIFLGRSFMTESFLGAGTLLVMFVAGFCSFAFEQRGMDVELASAQRDVALVLVKGDITCKIPSRSESFQRAAIACGVQSTSDLSAAGAEGAKLAHLPAEMDLIDKISSKFLGSNPNLCKEHFEPIYKACPNTFAELDKGIVDRVLSAK